jgi:DNA-binding transcriptional LysR family regulator
LSALFILESVERSGSLSKAAAEEDVSRARVTLALQRLDLQFGFAMLKADPLGKRTPVLTLGAKRLTAITRPFRCVLQDELEIMECVETHSWQPAKNSVSGAGAAAIRSISLTSLCTLESVGRTGGLSEAAIEEGLTLPGVGQAIARLEQHLGPLVTRRQDDSRRRVLTERGQRIALITRRFRAELQGVLDCNGEPPLSN